MRLWIPQKIAEFCVQKNIKVQVRLNKTEERSKKIELFFNLKIRNKPEYFPKRRCTNKTLGSRSQNRSYFQSFAWSIIFIISLVFYGAGSMNALLRSLFTVIQHKLTGWGLLQCIAPSHIKNMMTKTRLFIWKVFLMFIPLFIDQANNHTLLKAVRKESQSV